MREAMILQSIFLFIILFVSFVTYFYVRKFRKIVQVIDQIPGPNYSQFWGRILGILELFWTNFKIEDTAAQGFQILIGVSKLYQHTGIWRAWVGPFEHVVILFRADTVEALLTSNTNIQKAREYNFTNPWLGLGLLTSTGERWRFHRKLLTPTFHFNILENFVPCINGQQKIMLEIIEKMVNENNGVINDIRPIITNCALDTICETAMGVTVKAQTECNSDYVKSVRGSLLVLFERFLAPWLWNDYIFNISPMGIEFKKYCQILHQFTDSVIRERKKELIANKTKSFNDSDESGMYGKRRLAFLDSLLSHHLNNELTELDVRSEVDTFMFEGHDTSSSATQFALLLIGLHPEIQEKIHLELDHIFDGDKERDINLEDLRQMKFLEQCIKESLRLYPPVPYIARYSEEPFYADKYLIPPKTTCLILIYMLHRDPEFFPNPEVFDPDRFDDVRHPYAYVPFSAGPRNCIGQKFALLEEKAFLASILRKFRITSLVHRNEIRLDFSAILKSKTEIKMKFDPR